MKVLISDRVDDGCVEVLERNDEIAVDVKTGLSPAELLEVIGDYEGLIVRSGTQVTDEVIRAAVRLRVIGRAGAGVDNIDVAAATRRGIVVMNTPGETRCRQPNTVFPCSLHWRGISRSRLPR